MQLCTCIVCSIARVVPTVGSVTHTAPPLVRTLMHVPRLVMRAPNALSHAQAWFVGLDWKLFVATPPLQTLSRHKIFYRDRNGPVLGKLCRVTQGDPCRNPSTSPSPAPYCDIKFMSRCGAKYLYRDREGLCQDPNHPSFLGIV